MNPDCQTCANRYHGADGVDYCRPANSQRGIKCSEAAAANCKQFDPDVKPWFKDGWCVTSSSEGRGD